MFDTDGIPVADILTLYLPVRSADNLCILFWPRSGPKNIGPDLDSNSLTPSTDILICLYLLLPSADNSCKQFGPRSGPTKCRAGTESKLFDTEGIPVADILTLYLLVPSADNLCKQFGPRSGPTKHQA